ncbi:beta-1,3-galactosyltransferase 5 [Drosophila pseudoobscura]|uniref:Hexosyltransferase n=1 Tax=Drosophila pseudoobscura pseudoobscura TaxID=46245 RepID=A0A6I8UAZ0_DROPS|nr:beta-1,3-galactosyltransferase 5 [Drosophila pseudoobscura]XP_033238660.1 beta-1,3-galactosyltransferase 5 [Drosophila pseudoobscura]
MMDKRSLCMLVICVNLCLVIWLVSVQQPQMLETEAPASAAALTAEKDVDVSSETEESPPTPPPPCGKERIGRESRSWSRSWRSKPNQIHDTPSRIPSYNDSLDLSLTSQAAAPRTPAPQVFTNLMDLHNFAYLMNQPPCDARVQALILVHTSPYNHQKRALIRQTWADKKYIERTPLRVIFLLADVWHERPSWQHFLDQENAKNGDMVQGNFKDDYRNMTYKHVMALKWFNENCPQAQLLVKVDDDVYMNTPQLVKYLKDPTRAEHDLLLDPNLLLCRPVKAPRVKRSYRSKWRVTYKEYPYRYYPDYCPGFAIVYAPDVARRLFKAAQKAKYFWVDDALITGVLAKETHTKITSLQHVIGKTDTMQLIAGQIGFDYKEFLFAFHGIQPHMCNSLWDLTVETNYTLETSPSSSSAASSSPALSANTSAMSTGLS